MKRITVLVVAGSLAALAGVAQAAGDAAKGAEKVAVCAGCHGEKGEGILPDNPKISGMPEADFIKMMKGYKDGTVEGPVMQGFVGDLTDEDIADMAAYYAKQ